MKIQKSQTGDIFRRVYEICLFLGLTLYYPFAGIIHYIGVAAFIAGTAAITLEKMCFSKIIISVNTIWYLLFIVLTELSTLWAFDPVFTSYAYIKFMLVILVTGFGLSQYADSEKNVCRIIYIFLASVFAISVLIMSATPFESWFSSYFGVYKGIGNSNTYGYIVYTASVLSFFLGYCKSKKLFYPVALFFVFCTVISSSRKCIVATVFCIILLILFSFGKKHHILHFFIAVFASATAFYLILTNDVLHRAVGARFETLFEFIQGEVSAGDFSSLEIREYYIVFAKSMFERKPVLGYGFASFSGLLQAETTMSRMYAHNNYWQMLADLGIVGFIVYYWFYGYLLIKSIVKIIQKKSSGFPVLAFVMIICQLIIEWGQVTMSQPYPQFTISLIYIFLSFKSESEQKKYFYSENNKNT